MPPHDGNLSVGERIKRLEDEARASDENCRHSNTKVWHKFAMLELAWETKMNEVKVELARSQVKLAMIIGGVSFVASVIAAVLVKVLVK